MNRKALVLCMSALAVLLVGIVVAVFFLYSGLDKNASHFDAPVNEPRYGFFQAVPSDAVLVMHFDKLEMLSEALSGEGISSAMVPDGKFSRFLDSLKVSRAGGLYSSGAILSYHYVGGLQPLLLLDAGRSGADISSAFQAVKEAADAAGLYCSQIDCSQTVSGNAYLSRRTLVTVSPSDVLLSSSERHIAKGVSVLDKEGFAEALSQVQGGVGQILVSDSESGRILESICTKPYRKYADFFKRVSTWSAFSVDIDTPSRFVLSGSSYWSGGPDKFMNVFSTSPGGASSVFSVLPSYTVSALSLPMGDVQAAISSYASFAETRLGRAKYEAALSSLQKSAGVKPEDWAESLDIREVATASFVLGDTLTSVLLIKAGARDPLSVLVGKEISEDYTAKPHDYIYAGFAKALFGSLFSVADESKFVYYGGWIIAGSEAAVNEYASGRATDSTLDKYISGAGLDYAWAESHVHFLTYFSVTESPAVLGKVFSPKYSESIRSYFADAVYSPAMFAVTSAKGKLRLALTVDKVSQMRSKAPSFERDTQVNVPTGPFQVKNSATGKMNSFYQRENMYLCLEDENGKGLWGAEFHTPICGRASTVDYFANGKLQIIFCSGSKLYLIDRLGRWVSPFPVDLGKEILLGPDVYDFNDSRRYNVMVLHKDNTVGMYNLQGRKPASWKGIAPKETIKDLPQSIKVDGRTYWVVRTSIQTLIYPFYGGEPLTVFDDDRKIRPDSEIVPVKGGVKATRYDGKTVTVSLTGGQ